MSTYCSNFVLRGTRIAETLLAIKEGKTRKWESWVVRI